MERQRRNRGLRFNDEDYATIRIAAMEAGIEVSRFVRDVMIDHITGGKKEKPPFPSSNVERHLFASCVLTVEMLRRYLTAHGKGTLVTESIAELNAVLDEYGLPRL